ncbi:MAG: YeeE/YedE thiosulfate transporter family protein [Melioribacteraceae bacterium]|nr:YeeE/YedE thiosulfate transporter family protein [Melioribacteraceae bacterium]
MDNSKEWHWFTGGILVSLLSVATYFVFEALELKKYPFGVTAGFGYISALFGNLFGGLAENPVIQKYTKNILEFFLLIGLVIGGYAASKQSKTFSPENIPATWEKYHGKSLTKRYLVVLVGGILLGFGAPFAGGCTTGNILQGWAHLSLGSIVAGMSFFAAGIVTAKILYPNLGGENDTN